VKAIVVDHPGGPEVLSLRDVEPGEPGPHDLAVAITAAGVNYMDVGARTGQYGPPLPHVPGVEGAGTVTAIGSAVTDFAVGDRVAWYFAWGSYAERIVLPASAAVPIPPGIDDETAASVMMQGLTARRHGARALGRGRGRPAADPDREGARRSRHRQGVHRGEGGHRPCLFGWLLDGTLAHRIGGHYPLADAARAHTDLESRRTTGKLLLLPG